MHRKFKVEDYCYCIYEDTDIFDLFSQRWSSWSVRDAHLYYTKNPIILAKVFNSSLVTALYGEDK